MARRNKQADWGLRGPKVRDSLSPFQKKISGRLFSRLRRGDALFFVDREEQVIAETVAPVKTPSPPIGINFRAARKPPVHIPFSETHRPVFVLTQVGS